MKTTKPRKISGVARMQFLAVLLLLVCVQVMPATTVVEVQPLHNRALLIIRSDQSGPCIVRVSTTNNFGAGYVPVHDVNPNLFTGSDQCSRPGSSLAGAMRYFVVGTPRAAQASDQKWYSRAIQSSTKHYFQVTVGNDTFIGRFTTTSAQWGARGTAVPFDRNAPYNYAWPTIDWADRSKTYVDPLSGALVKRLTGPQMVPTIQVNNQAGIMAYDTGTDWTNPSNAAAVDGAVATVTNKTGKLAIRLPQLCINGSYDCTATQHWPNQAESIDDIQVTVTAQFAGASNSANICLSVDGVSCATATKVLNFSTSLSPRSFPSSGYPSPIFNQWLGGAVVQPPSRVDLGTKTGIVNTSGTAVTLVSGSAFDAASLKAGSRITIGGTNYSIASVTDATHLTLDNSAGTQTAAAYTSNNVVLLIWTTVDSTLSVDGATFNYAGSIEYEIGSNGSVNLCNPNLITVSTTKGYACVIPSTTASYSQLMFIVPATGEGRNLGFLRVPYHVDVSSGVIDGNYQECIAPLITQSGTSVTVYCVARSDASPSQGDLLFRGTYNGDFSAVSTPGAVASMQWEFLTKPSQGRSLRQLIAGSSPAYDAVKARFPTCTHFGILGDYLGVRCGGGDGGTIAQDTMQWFGWLALPSLTLQSTSNTYSAPSCRWCGMHGAQAIGDSQYGGFSAKDLPGNSSASDWNAGPYVVKITASSSGGSNGLLNNLYQEVCPIDIPQSLQDLGAVGNRCVTLTLAGNPCDLTPSTWETANAPVCSWNPSGREFQPLAVGDSFEDQGEKLVLVKSLGSHRWVALRNYKEAYAPLLLDISPRALGSHGENWTAVVTCTAGRSNGYAWHEIATGNVIANYAFSPAEHGDHTAIGSVAVGFMENSRVGAHWTTSVWDQQPFGSRIAPGITASKVWLNDVSFGGLNVSGTPIRFIQTHPSWRQVSASRTEQQWYLDGNVLAASGGGVYQLWNQPGVTNVQGSLWKIPAAYVTLPGFRKYLDAAAWSGRYLLEDVSGPSSAIDGSPSDNWKLCVADFANECSPGSSVGDVFMNVPSLTNDGTCGNAGYAQRPCYGPIIRPGIGLVQYDASRQTQLAQGRLLTTAFQHYNFTWTYATAVPIPDGSWAVTSGSWLGLSRSDLLLVKIPPSPPSDSANRSDFVNVAITIPRMDGAHAVRVKFGYDEYGPPDQFYCTSRREACVASATVRPFAWAGESSNSASCSAGCTVEIPALAGRVLYYQIERLSPTGSLIATTSLQATTVN